jgi:cbb3-type cytochrome oxidase subunit 3
MKANRQATLLGALFLLFILVLLAALLLRRRKNAAKAKRRLTTLAQPKHSAQPAAPVNMPASSITSRDFVNEDTARPRASEVTPLAVPVSANAPRTSAIQEKAEHGKPVAKSAMARSAAAAPPNHAWVPASSSTGSSTDEDQEREVFEL